ncbi:uracil-DNA glycosylase [Candidatus Kinetoplastidibacterium crithidiae]|uniref:Type-4 uracil-DNA glycosylase n=1 Tax=Candidatus Kinetoplastidibacterium crithidiae TCC036E TaxID=1208918 RepID=M1L552_9PROT|nr:uracil-DNA glycosylase [Candidatus Kinetoplastibacterium crithidii]AFZ82570.1 DNA polymerase bacteriophage-type [Candidatus Kinetoplastibacterium crithidii (ex Angomonas deanei ATCC 30255)]AGF47768.1 DNA polymerase bacteriophage-type [Candidatus Kinetoplastibacterium crithidii TCC036E]
MLFYLKNKNSVSYIQRILLKEIGVRIVSEESSLNRSKHKEKFLKIDNPSIEENISNDHRANKINSNNFDILKNVVNKCQLCDLCHSRKNVVFGSGNITQCSCLIIGEAPGEQEDATGIPFVGRSGKLLDQMLNAIEIHRDRETFITNIVKCRPPANRNPKLEELESCRPFLLEQIDFLKPSKILVLGKFAANAVLNNSLSIRELRGKVHYFSSGNKSNDIPVIVSYHPAYLLRRPEEKSLVWDDLCLLKSV